jgi:hypothetical protein
MAAGMGGPSAAFAARGARRLPGGVLLVERSSLPAPLLAALRRATALLPVYRRGGAIVVPLPEIRIEIDDERQRTAVMEALASAPHEVRVIESAQDRILVAPASGRSEDAIDVANHLHETAHPAAASVRFLQVVPRPEPRQPATASPVATTAARARRRRS